MLRYIRKNPEQSLPSRSTGTVSLDGGSSHYGHSVLKEKKHKQPQEHHKTKMAVQETASQLSMALKVQEYPTLKVNEN